MILLMVCLEGCSDEWDSHYEPSDNKVNQSMWEYIRNVDNYALYEKYIIDNKLDTLFEKNQQYTLFIPTDEAFRKLPDSVEINSFILKHLISSNVLNLRNITSSKMLYTLSGKFALIESSEEKYYFDGIEITSISPLFLDGKYYEVKDLPQARPNIDEYFKYYFPTVSNYISSMAYDSLDKRASTPVGFDELGNTIYDSIFIVINPFESMYFPISKESREEFATFVICTNDQYISALDQMALTLGGNFFSHEDIPLEWQEKILLPGLFKNGIFKNILSFDDLLNPNILNINGDKVNLDIMNIDPDTRFLCSNGVIYSFNDFHIPESYYLGSAKIEGEDLLDSIGFNKYAWKEFILTTGSISEPVISRSELASEGASVNVLLGRAFSGIYSVELLFRNIFPGRYRLEWKANYRPSGIYKIYVNDDEVGEFDTFNLRYTLPSVTGQLFKPNNAGYNKIDFWVENLSDYGDVRLKFEYQGSGVSTDNGLNIDYVSLISSPE